MLTTALLRHLQIRVDYVTIEWPTENRRENNDETRRSEKKIVCHYEAAKKSKRCLDKSDSQAMDELPWAHRFAL